MRREGQGEVGRRGGEPLSAAVVMASAMCVEARQLSESSGGEHCVRRRYKRAQIILVFVFEPGRASGVNSRPKF